MQRLQGQAAWVGREVKGVKTMHVRNAIRIGKVCFSSAIIKGGTIGKYFKPQF